MARRINAAGLSHIMQWEGKRLVAYQDVAGSSGSIDMIGRNLPYRRCNAHLSSIPTRLHRQH